MPSLMHMRSILFHWFKYFVWNQFRYSFRRTLSGSVSAQLVRVSTSKWKLRLFRVCQSPVVKQYLLSRRSTANVVALFANKRSWCLFFRIHTFILIKNLFGSAAGTHQQEPVTFIRKVLFRTAWAYLEAKKFVLESEISFDSIFGLVGSNSDESFKMARQVR